MNSLMARRRALLASEKEPIDTTVRIMQTGVYWDLRLNRIADAQCAITEKYAPDMQIPNDGNEFGLALGFPPDDKEHKYAVYRDGEEKPFDYWTVVQPRFTAGGKYVSFSILLSAIDDCYAYVIDTGTVLFAGKNTPYYGKTNINS